MNVGMIVFIIVVLFVLLFMMIIGFLPVMLDDWLDVIERIRRMKDKREDE